MGSRFIFVYFTPNEGLPFLALMTCLPAELTILVLAHFLAPLLNDSGHEDPPLQKLFYRFLLSKANLGLRVVLSPRHESSSAAGGSVYHEPEEPGIPRIQ